MNYTQFRKKSATHFLLGVFLACSVTSCSSTSSENTGMNNNASVNDSSPTTTTAVATVDQSKELIFAASRDQAPGANDSVYCTINLGVWQPLVTQDELGKPSPALAESWESNEECTQWNFYLKEGVTFSNGVEFNADIVLENFKRYELGPFTSSFYGFNINNIYPNLEEVVAVNTHEVQLIFSEPYPMLPYAMTNFFSPMFEPSCFAEDGSFSTHAIGTGPFVITENVLGEYCSLIRNETYYGELPTIENIKFRVIPDANTRYSALMSGEIHAVGDIGAITPSLALELEKNSDYHVTSGASGIVHYLHSNGNAFPWDDVRMREGLSLIFNREEINQEFYSGYSTPATGFLSYAYSFYNDDLTLDYDFQRGKSLIEEVLGEERISVDFILSEGDMSRYPHKEQAEYMQAILSEVGIDANISTMAWSAVQEKLKTGDFDLCLKIQGMSSADPYALMKAYMHSEGSTNLSYGLGYANEEVDLILEDVLTELDMSSREAVYDTLQEIANEEFPTIPILFTRDVVACTSDLGGYVSTPYGIKSYTSLYWEN